MDAETLKSVLESRGWRAEIDDNPSDIVKVNRSGLFKCVDGRESDHTTRMRGPKALGGIYAIASMRDKRKLSHLKTIVAEVKKKGYVPSVHGDAHGPVGCGYFKLWKTGQLPGVRPPAYDGPAGRAAVLDAGGKFEWLKGGHEEWYTIINLRPKTTFEPKPKDQRFVLDAWIASEFKLDIGRYATIAAETVERLRPAAMVAKIVV